MVQRYPAECGGQCRSEEVATLAWYGQSNTQDHEPTGLSPSGSVPVLRSVLSLPIVWRRN